MLSLMSLSDVSQKNLGRTLVVVRGYRGLVGCDCCKRDRHEIIQLACE